MVLFSVKKSGIHKGGRANFDSPKLNDLISYDNLLNQLIPTIFYGPTELIQYPLQPPPQLKYESLSWIEVQVCRLCCLL